jgi:hypothetical protein
MSNASKWAAALILCSFSLAFVACGDSSSGNDAGSSGTAGSSGGGTGTAGAGGTNATGTGGGAAGRGGGGGTTGTAGGSGANCQMCVACAQTNCAGQVTTCMGNPACNTIWQCATACTMTLNQCIQMNPGGVTAFAALAQCANTSCTQNGCPY